MKNFKSIDRLYEMHAEGEVSQELLSMTVGEMLDRLEELDTQDSVEYEIIEDAIKRLSDKIIGFNPESNRLADPAGVEMENEYPEPEMGDDMISFGDMNQGAADQSSGDLDDFSF
jgi:hypothetical protein